MTLDRITKLIAELNANVLTSDYERAETIIAALSKWWGCEAQAHPSTDTTSEERLILHHLREVRLAAKLLWLGREQELKDLADELEERYRDANLDNDNLRAAIRAYEQARAAYAEGLGTASARMTDEERAYREAARALSRLAGGCHDKETP